MFKKNALIALALVLVTQISMADVLETNRTLKEYIVYFEQAKNIRLNFEYTEQVDSCNGHSLNANLYTLNDYSYLANLSLTSTQMFCDDDTMHPETFTYTVDMKRDDGSFFYILAPTNARFSAEVIK